MFFLAVLYSLYYNHLLFTSHYNSVRYSNAKHCNALYLPAFLVRRLVFLLEDVPIWSYFIHLHCNHPRNPRGAKRRSGKEKSTFLNLILGLRIKFNGLEREVTNLAETFLIGKYETAKVFRLLSDGN